VAAPPCYGFLDQVLAESLKLPAFVWRAVLEGQLAADTTARLEQIQAPTLILWGDQDTIFPRSEQEKLRDGIARAELKVYAETGHSAQWERPEQVVRDMEACLASLA
jgi:pimeloyl-ACP methyl ester carboxylesterase